MPRRRTMISWRTRSSADTIDIMHAIAVRKATMDNFGTLERFRQSVVSAERPYRPSLNDGTVRHDDIAETLSREEVLITVAEYVVGQ